MTTGAPKRVHFAEAPLRPPSPAHSDLSSAASSSGPSTPPPMHTLLPPPSNVSAVSSSSPDLRPAQIHAAIAFKPDAPCQLGWDVSVHPSRLPLPQGITAEAWSAVLKQPATHPPLPSMMILSSILHHPIVVKPADKGASHSHSHSPGTPSSLLSPELSSYVTVHDVLHSLYSSLRTPLTHEEYNALQIDHQRDVAHAYTRRVSRVEDRKRELERAKGVKRIDLLLAEQQPIFNGLGATKRARDIWVLNLTQ